MRTDPTCTEREHRMIKPASCKLICTASYMQCETCSLCPETADWQLPSHSYGWHWCDEWLIANQIVSREYLEKLNKAKYSQRISGEYKNG